MLFKTAMIQRITSIVRYWSSPHQSQMRAFFFFRHLSPAAGTNDVLPQLVGIPNHIIEENHSNKSDADDDLSIWNMAVPKRKHTKSRKRMKTTSQKRLKLKKNIVFDPRTGEVSLMHKLPFNWKEYLPKTDEQQQQD